MILKLAILTHWNTDNGASEVHSQGVHGSQSGFRITKHDIGPWVNPRSAEELSLSEGWDMLRDSHFDCSITSVDVEVRQIPH